MENQHQKLVTVSYLALSALVYFILMIGLMKVSSALDLESKVKSIEFIIRGGTLLIAALVFFILLKNPKANLFMNDVATELLTKSTWPTSKETFSATGVVIVTVLIAGFVLGLFDWVFVYLLRTFI